MALRVERALNAFVVREDGGPRRHVLDLLAYATANILVDNDLWTPAIEIVDGFVEMTFDEGTLLAVTGDAEVEVGGRRGFSAWSLVPAPKGARVRVSARGGVAYVSVAGGLKETVRKRLLRDSEELGQGDAELERLIEEYPARHLPPMLIPERPRRLRLKVALADPELNLPRLYTVSGRDLSRGIVLSPVGGVAPKADELPKDDPAVGTITAVGGSLGVPMIPSEEERPVVAEVHPMDMDGLARAVRGALVELREVPREEIRRGLTEELRLIERVRRVVSAACEALKRGAVLVRVKVNGKIFEAWVEELK